MPKPTTDPKVSIMNLVSSGWTPANIVGTVTPEFHTGWHNPANENPQITFTSDSVSFRGEAGFGAIGSPDPVQIADGTLFVNVWARRSAGGVNPKQLTYDMAMEVSRILAANYDQITNLDFVNVQRNDEVPPDMENEPNVFRRSLTVVYRWRSV